LRDFFFAASAPEAAAAPMSSPLEEWRPIMVTVTLVTVPGRPETLMLDG
jgi:hypothetical protein